MPTIIKTLSAMTLALSVFITAPALAADSPALGQQAPVFKHATASGETITLDQFKGQPVVLEWTNHQCPYVEKHYDTGNMQATQKFADDKGAVWISVISSAPGKQGHVSAEKALNLMEKRDAHADYVIRDENGEIGKMYGARTTPHMYVINAQGTLTYKGAIDDKPTARGGVEGATNYVKKALTSLSADEPIEVAQSQPYGCSVKY
jgi:peroxiredoxin